MDIINFSEQNSIISQYLAEVCDEDYQRGRLLSRSSVIHIGKFEALEIPKTLNCEPKDVVTLLGAAQVSVPTDKIVLAAIFRVGLPFHNGFLNIFSHAGNAFISVHQKYMGTEHYEVGIHAEYLATPGINDKILIIINPVLATGGPIKLGYKTIFSKGTPRHVHVTYLLATPEGTTHIRKTFPENSTTIWCAAIDEGLNEHKHIVPGSDDAGDLCYGEKL